MARSAKPRKRKPAPQRSKLPRYVVKLHPDDFFDEEDAEVLRFDNFDDAVECCADLGIPFFLDAGNKKLVFWFVRVDDEGYPEIARCTEREFATILAGISAGGMYCPECGTVHWPDGDDRDRKSGSAGMPRPISYAVFCLKKKKKKKKGNRTNEP
ncbi:Uncharacterised protein [Escherichia fergusonii]|nr:Uncharacterised protein [Escherichia fergusonii]